VRFGDAERTVETLTLITTTGGRRATISAV
jgi:hypothetical protein